MKDFEYLNLMSEIYVLDIQSSRLRYVYLDTTLIIPTSPSLSRALCIIYTDIARVPVF